MYIGRLGSYITRGVYTVSGPFHPFGGAVDIIVVEQPDGSFKSSPWYIRFGKFQGVLKAREKVVSINVNGVDVDLHMYLDERGQAYFLRDVEGEEGESVSSSSSGDETDEQYRESMRTMMCKSCNYDSNKFSSVDQINCGKIVARSNSRRSKIFGLVFGQKSLKKDDYQDEGEGSVTSLERAEFAANLLDVKWSTNLKTISPRKIGGSTFSASVTSDCNQGNDKSTNNGQIRIGSPSQLASETSVDQCSSADETGSSNVEMDGFLSGFENQEVFVEQANVETSSSGITKQTVNTFMTNEHALEEKEEISEISRGVGEHNLQTTCQGADGEGVASTVAFPDQKLSNGWVSDERNVGFSGFGNSEESGSDRIQSFLYCEKPESSVLGLDGSKDQAEETIYLISGGPGKVHFHSEAFHVTTEQLPEDRVTQEAEIIELGSFNLESFDSPQQTDPSSLIMHDHDEYNFEGSLAGSESHTQMVTLDPILSVVDIRSNSISSISGFSNSGHQIQNEIHIGDKVSSSDFQSSLNSSGDSELLKGEDDLAKSVTVQISESSEEQFLFSDIDELEHGEINDKSNFPVSNKEESASSCPVATDEVNWPANTNDEYDSLEPGFLQDNQMADTNMGNSKAASSPVFIPKMNRTANVEVRQLGESLPNTLLRTKNLSAMDIKHPLSQSLGSNAKSIDWKLHSTDESHFINSHTEKENQLPPERSNNDNSNYSEDVTNAVVNPAVEISLCKHLLYEGMGAEAASQAFDAEKLDIDKLTSIGPTIVKNDRLIVRISGKYFPWDAAAPIILGMVTFGSKVIFEPKGMIPVDRIEKSFLESPSGGSWRFWPFSFRRSRSRKATQPTLVKTWSSDTENVSDSNIVADGDRTAFNPKVKKKTVRANTPTSEELASLNLKEGCNAVTFAFSTAMLGKQKVDARIYLWKWNTRIVISDVDGTITRSDVLGQFMPLVGIDWSQTGVAHLFSAIKENGYQLLFLSARAISQAYITRQFLVNLKQDGKALPDGPVVISPDGLFPSLFREVIRRAPHEFKIACLEDIKALFPPDCNPFYAGFGNRDTDEISYLKVGIPKGKIFIINPKGEVAVNRRVDTKSYTSLHDLVHGMFPARTSSEQEAFNSWNFWRLPPPDIDL